MTSSTGTLHVDPTNLAVRLTELGDLNTMIGQCVANSIDAGATQIEIYFHRTEDDTSYTVHIVDNGSGIVGTIPKIDNDWLDLFAEEHGSKSETYNPFTEFQKITSALSFQTIMKSAGFSVKAVPGAYQRLVDELAAAGWELTSLDELQGVYAIGLLEAIGTGSDYTLTSKAVGALAQLHYGTRSIPTYVLYPPTREQLKARKPEYRIEEVPDLVHPRSGEILEHGTIVTVKGIGDGRSVDIRNLMHELNRVFGGFVVSGKIEPIVISQRKFRGKRPYVDYVHVRGLRIKGDLILNETVHGEQAGFKANVRLYDVKKEGNPLGGVRFVRYGSVGDLVTTVRGFTGVWEDLRLSGTVEIIVPMDVRDDAWNAQKTKPSLRNHGVRDLLEKVKELAEKVERWFENSDKEKERQRYENLGTVLKRRLSRILAGFPELQNLAIVDASDKSAARTKARKNRTKAQELPGLVVWVINEHGLRLSEEYDVAIEISYSPDNTNFDQPILLKPQRGKLDMGEPRPGMYRIKLLLPHGLSMMPGSSDTFEATYLKEDTLKHVFRVRTGEPSRVRNALKSLNIVFDKMGEDERHFDADALEQTGLLIINADEPVLAKAFQSNDKHSIGWRVSQFVAHALCEVIYAGQSTTTINEQARIISGMLAMEVIADWATAMPVKRR